MSKEIEYKFICKELPFKKWEGQRLLQGYIHIDSEKQVRIRVCLTTQTAKICIKFMQGNTRQEFEADTDFHEGLHLYELCKYKLAKTRYIYYYGIKFDIDVYDNGIMTVEIETDKEEIPDVSDYLWIGDNVDGQWKYNNYSMAGFPEEEYIKNK